MDDWAKLREFVERGSEEAFGEIVRRYIDPVYSRCKRELGDAHLAEDATQAVFVVLARKAQKLKRGVVLSGWLFQTARFACASMRRTESKRKEKEREAGMMRMKERSEAQADRGGDGMGVLDEALETLRNGDRDVVLLRYERGLSMVEVAEELGVSEAAVRQRLSRAVARLQKKLAASGAIAAAEGVPVMLERAVQRAPVGLGAKLKTGTASGGVAKVVSGVQMRWIMMKAKLAAMVLGTAIVAGGGTVAAVIEMGSHGGTSAAMPMAEGKQNAQSMADAHNWAGAIDAYGEELRGISVEQYRDKKDFGWIIDAYAKASPDGAAPGGGMWEPLKKIFQQKITQHADDAIFAWRLHRGLADIAERAGDAAGEKTELEQAIKAYPVVNDSDPARHSSLQHLYNQYGLLLAKDHVADGVDYVSAKFAADERFVYFFTSPWKQLLKDQPNQYRDLIKKVLASYDDKAKQHPEQGEMLMKYRAELDGEAK